MTATTDRRRAGIAKRQSEAADRVAARDRLLECCERADALMLELGDTLAERRKAIGAATTAGWLPSTLATKALHRLSVDRAIAAAGLSEACSIFVPSAPTRRPLAEQIRAIMREKPET